MLWNTYGPRNGKYKAHIEFTVAFSQRKWIRLGIKTRVFNFYRDAQLISYKDKVMLSRKLKWA